MAVLTEHITPGQHRQLELQRGVKLRLLHGGSSHSVFLIEVEPGGGAIAAAHAGQELRYVISGSLTFTVADRAFEVAAGGTLRHSCACAHGFRAGPGGATFLTVALSCRDYIANLFRGVTEGEPFPD